MKVMIRKTVFFGLTLILVIAFVALVIRGRKLERQQAERPPTFLSESSSPVRAFAPSDLDIVGLQMKLEQDGTARHEFELSNEGKVTYQSVQLEFVYRDAVGSQVAAKRYSVSRVLEPGRSAEIDDAVVGGVPLHAASVHGRVVFGEIASEGDRQ